MTHSTPDYLYIKSTLNMGVNSYAEGMSYEIFMKRAFQTTDNRKPGIHLSYLTNLIDAENGESWVSHLPKAQKQLEKVKGYIEKALVKLVKSNKDSGVKSILSALQLEVSLSSSSYELIGVIRKALDVTSAYNSDVLSK